MIRAFSIIYSTLTVKKRPLSRGCPDGECNSFLAFHSHLRPPSPLWSIVTTISLLLAKYVQVSINPSQGVQSETKQIFLSIHVFHFLFVRNSTRKVPLYDLYTCKNSHVVFRIGCVYLVPPRSWIAESRRFRRCLQSFVVIGRLSWRP